MTVAQHMKVEEMLRGGHSPQHIADVVGVLVEQVERIKAVLLADKKVWGRRR